jgi:hypothetical protein
MSSRAALEPISAPGKRHVAWHRICTTVLLALALAPSIVLAERQSYVVLVFSNPTAGREDEYTRWYNAEHLPAVVSVPGSSAGSAFN